MFAGRKGLTVNTIIAMIIILAVLVFVSIIIYVLAKKDFSLGQFIENLFRFGGR